tara:strand:- start:252 stop:971 length:720 start_codon:yes stop_codon:yes gene_type:complete
MNKNNNSLQYLLNKFQIFRDNWEELRDEVLINGVDNFNKHPQCDCTWGEVNGIPTNLGKALIASEEKHFKNIELYPKAWELFKEINLDGKQTFGYSLLQPTGKIHSHIDPEHTFRYHLCLQAGYDESNIDGTSGRTTQTDLWLNEGEDIILEPGVHSHSAYNNSEDVLRIHLVLDWIVEDGKHIVSPSLYKKAFGGIEGWDDDTWIESSNYYHSEGCSSKNPCSNDRCDNYKGDNNESF